MHRFVIRIAPRQRLTLRPGILESTTPLQGFSTLESMSAPGGLEKESTYAPNPNPATNTYNFSTMFARFEIGSSQRYNMSLMSRLTLAQVNKAAFRIPGQKLGVAASA
jgi:hypothetical protein